MKHPLRIFLILTALLVVTLVMMAPASADGHVVINELLVSHSGTDDTEFVELYGTPGASLSGLSLIVVEGDSFGPGTIDVRADFAVYHEIGANGFFLWGNCAGLADNYAETPDASLQDNTFENSSLTMALVETDSLSGGVGTLITGAEVVVDAVALTDGDSGDVFYFDAPVIGPDGSNFPAGARRLVDGANTGTVADWTLASFFLPGDNTPTGGGLDGCSPIMMDLTIPEIQGDGRYSPYTGVVATTEGVVTLLSAGDFFDMWIQDPEGDGDPTTSDGIFVDDAYRLDPPPKVGDLVRVTAEVEELQFGNALSLTRLDDPHRYEFEILSEGNPLPDPVPLVDLPNWEMANGEAFWEPLEGMRVYIENGFVVAATNGFGEFGMLTEIDADADLESGYFAQMKQILIQSLGMDDGDYVVDYNPERIMVDDYSLDKAIDVATGDRVRHMTGVVDYTFSMYKLQPDTYEVFNHKAPKMPVSKRSGGFGNFTITSFNIENLFDLEFNDSVDVDSFGEMGFDPGSSWGPPSTANNTLIRKPGVCMGQPDASIPFDPSVQWDGQGNNYFDDLGTHTTTCTETEGLFISEYVEGSSLNKALEIYNGTGEAVNLGPAGVVVEVYFNGNTSPGTTIGLSGMLAAGDVFVLAHEDADDDILAVADQVTNQNLFNGDDAIVLRVGGKDDAGSTPEPEELAVKLEKLALAIEVELELPEIIVVQETENQAILQELGDMVNDANGTAYRAVSFETSDARGIEVGFLFDENRTTLIDAYQMSGPAVEEWFGPTSPSPGREPLVGVFEVMNREVTIIGNHFKSKGGDDPLYGVNWPPVRATEVQRKGQAQVVRDFVNEILDEDPDALVLVAGDLNDFQFSEPGEGPDHPVAILEGSEDEVPLINLATMEKPPETFSYVFDGNSQLLDHVLVSPGLFEYFKAVDILHFNNFAPAKYEMDPTVSYGSSDHDPVEARFFFK